MRDLRIDGEVMLTDLHFPGTQDWGGKVSGWRDIVFADGDGIALNKGVHTLRMTNLNGEGLNLGWLALIPVEELPLALDPARPDRLESEYLKVLEIEFKLKNSTVKQ